MHIVDEATHFTPAIFLKRHTASEIWRTVVLCWNKVYLGPTDYLHVDQGSNYISKEFGECAEAECIKLLKAPIESPGTMSHVEIYDALLRAAYMKIR